MKKLLCAGLLIFSAFAFSACGNKEEAGYEAEESDDTIVLLEGDRDLTGTKYESKLTKLGNYKNLTYTWENEYTPSDAEIREEMESFFSIFSDEEMTEEAVKENLDYASMDEFYEDCREELISNHEIEVSEAAIEELFAKIIEDSVFEMSDNEREAYYNDTVSWIEGVAEEENSSVEEVVDNYWEMNMDEFKVAVYEEADSTIGVSLVTEAIIAAENIDVQKLWPEYMTALLEDYGYQSEAEFEEDSETHAEIVDEIKYNIVVDYLLENNEKVIK